MAGGSPAPYTAPEGIIRQDIAETFTESDVTLSHHKTRLIDGTITLAKPEAITNPDATTSSGTRWGTRSDDGETGMRFETAYSLSGLDLTLLSDIGSGPFPGLEVQSGDGSTTYARIEGPIPLGSSHSISVDIPAGRFRVVVDGSSDSTPGAHTGGTPVTPLSSPVAITSGTPDVNGWWVFESITPSVPPSEALTGSTTVSWPAPEDILTWEKTTYIADPDAGAVTVDMIDTSNGTVLLSDVERGVDLSEIPTTVNVGLRVSMSRPTADDDAPDFRAGYRQWTV